MRSLPSVSGGVRSVCEVWGDLIDGLTSGPAVSPDCFIRGLMCLLLLPPSSCRGAAVFDEGLQRGLQARVPRSS